MSIFDYKPVPADNQYISAIYVGEGWMAPDANNAFRQLMADLSNFVIGGGGGGAAISEEYTATAGQTVFATVGVYTPNLLGVYVNGIKLSSAEFAATDGTNVSLFNPAAEGDIVSFLSIAGNAVIDASEAIFTQPSPGVAVPRPVQNKLEDIVNVMDFYKSTDPDITNALERVIYFAFPGVDALEIYIPRGIYTVSRQIIPRRQVIIRGAGESATVLKFVGVADINATMKGAFSFGTLDTLNAYTTNTDGKITASGANSTNGTAWSQISDLQIQVPVGSPLDSIWSATLLTVSNVFSLHGAIRFTAGNLQSDTAVTIVGNCNVSSVERCTVLNANLDGFVCDGSDANIITFHKCNNFRQGRYGFVDASFLGGVFIGCHSDCAGTGASNYKGINPSLAQRSVYVGCYAEANGTGPSWATETGSLILAPQGGPPVQGAFGANATLMATAGAGHWSNQSLTITPRESDAFEIGDATHRAVRISDNGIIVRAGNGEMVGMLAGGDGGYLTVDTGSGPVNVMRIAKGAAIVTPVHVSSAPSQAEFNYLVDIVGEILTRMRTGLPNIAV